MGRNCKPQKEKSVVIGISLPPAVAEKLKRLCGKYGKASQIVAALIDRAEESSNS